MVSVSGGWQRDCRQRQPDADLGAALRQVAGRDAAAEGARHVHGEEQAQPAPRAPLARLVGLAEPRQDGRIEPGAGIGHGDAQQVGIAFDGHAHPAGRGVPRIVQHIENHLLQHGVRYHGRVGAEAVVVVERGDGARGPPVPRERIDEGAHRGLRGRLAARLAGRQQDAAHDALAALHLDLHFRDLVLQHAVGGQPLVVPPVAQDDGHGGQRRAELVRRTRGQQAHADDVFLFQGPLARRREARIALAQVALDAGDEDDHQDRVDQKAHQQTQQVGAGQAPVQVRGQGQRQVEARQRREAAGGDRHDRPDVAAAQQHRADRDLQQVEEDERIAGATAQVELHREHGHVDQQREEEFHVPHAVTGAPAQQADEVEQHQAAHDHEHLAHRQRQPEAVVGDLDGEHLADGGHPAQLDQLVQVLEARGGVRVAGVAHRRRGGRRGGRGARAGISVWSGRRGGGHGRLRADETRSVPHTSPRRQPSAPARTT